MTPFSIDNFFTSNYFSIVEKYFFNSWHFFNFSIVFFLFVPYLFLSPPSYLMRGLGHKRKIIFASALLRKAEEYLQGFLLQFFKVFLLVLLGIGLGVPPGIIPRYFFTIPTRMLTDDPPEKHSCITLRLLKEISLGVPLGISLIFYKFLQIFLQKFLQKFLFGCFRTYFQVVL